MIQPKDLIQDYVLITYDIPAEKKKLRREFLFKIGVLGAEQYTQSVYLLPYSEEALAAAGELNSAGYAVVWRAHQPDEQKAIEITHKYEQGIKARCAAIEQRLVVVQDYIAKGWLQRAQTMGVKTMKLITELKKINKNYEPGWLKERIDKMVVDYMGIHG